MKVPFPWLRVASVALTAAITLGFFSFLLSQIVQPIAFGRIGTDPSTGRRWEPTGVDLIVGYTSLSLATILSAVITTVRARELRDCLRRSVGTRDHLTKNVQVSKGSGRPSER